MGKWSRFGIDPSVEVILRRIFDEIEQNLEEFAFNQFDFWDEDEEYEYYYVSFLAEGNLWSGWIVYPWDGLEALLNSEDVDFLYEHQDEVKEYLEKRYGYRTSPDEDIADAIGRALAPLYDEWAGEAAEFYAESKDGKVMRFYDNHRGFAFLVIAIPKGRIEMED